MFVNLCPNAGLKDRKAFPRQIGQVDQQFPPPGALPGRPAEFPGRLAKSPQIGLKIRENGYSGRLATE
jgi:hypothetical protein